MTDPSVGVYVHVPFCERVCPYCDFAVVAARPLGTDLEQRYVDALLAELEQRAAVFSGRRLVSLYLGGGTPSLLQPESVERIVSAVGRVLGPVPTEPDLELTLEVNPSTLERSRLPGFRQAGVNRLSVGVQSFDDVTLKRLGRAHRAEEARATLKAAREAGFDNLSLDLIFGVPGQELAGVAADLAETLAFGPEHVSVYGLTLEAGTPFARAAQGGRLTLPPEDVTVSMMSALREELCGAGLAQYEISSFARPGREARHNRRYWERLPVLGLGVGAFSTDPATPGAPFGARRGNHRSLEAYLSRVEAGESGAAEPPEVLDERTARSEAVFLGLRTTRGLPAADFAREFGASPRSLLAEAIDELAEAGLLHEESDGSLCLTPAGQLLSDTVFERFV